MAAAKIDGTAIAKSIRQGLKSEIEQIQVRWQCHQSWRQPLLTRKTFGKVG
jgi:hypothetical protein